MCLKIGFSFRIDAGGSKYFFAQGAKCRKINIPEVANPYHPVVSEILSTEKSQSILKIINQNDYWKKILIEKGKIKSFENQKLLLEKKEVKLMRLRRCLENIQMLNTLVESHKVEQLKSFLKLQDLERLTLDQL